MKMNVDFGVWSRVPYGVELFGFILDSLVIYTFCMTCLRAVFYV